MTTSKTLNKKLIITGIDSFYYKTTDNKNMIEYLFTKAELFEIDIEIHISIGVFPKNFKGFIMEKEAKVQTNDTEVVMGVNGNNSAYKHNHFQFYDEFVTLDNYKNGFIKDNIRMVLQKEFLYPNYSYCYFIIGKSVKNHIRFNFDNMNIEDDFKIEPVEEAVNIRQVEFKHDPLMKQYDAVTAWLNYGQRHKTMNLLECGSEKNFVTYNTKIYCISKNEGVSAIVKSYSIDTYYAKNSIEISMFNSILAKIRSEQNRGTMIGLYNSLLNEKQDIDPGIAYEYVVLACRYKALISLNFTELANEKLIIDSNSGKSVKNTLDMISDTLNDFNINKQTIIDLPENINKAIDTIGDIKETYGKDFSNKVDEVIQNFENKIVKGKDTDATFLPMAGINIIYEIMMILNVITFGIFDSTLKWMRKVKLTMGAYSYIEYYTDYYFNFSITDYYAKKKGGIMANIIPNRKTRYQIAIVLILMVLLVSLLLGTLSVLFLIWNFPSFVSLNTNIMSSMIPAFIRNYIYGVYLSGTIYFMFFTSIIIAISPMPKNVKFIIILMKLIIYAPKVDANDFYPHVIYGTCSPNNVAEMFLALLSIYKRNRTKTSNYAITRIPQELLTTGKVTCNAKYSDRLCQKGFILNGHNIKQNYPFKLHQCAINEAEAVFRQLKSLAKPESRMIKKLSKFVQKVYIPYLLQNDEGEINVDDWLNSLETRQQIEYRQAKDDYEAGKVNRNKHRMHVKIDEKIFMDYSKIKVKARNVTAQDSLGKYIMGALIDHISKVQKQCDPGYGSGINFQQRCEKFKEWVDEKIKYVVLCLDGSAFDSTQHWDIMKVVDIQIYEAFIRNHPEISEWINIADLVELINTEKFLVSSNHFSYFVKGTQMTGRMNTSQGNTTRSLCYARLIWLEMGRNWLDLRIEASGDDQIIIISPQDCERFIEVAKRDVYYHNDVDEVCHGLGQIAKTFDVFQKINGAEYLSCYFLEDKFGNLKMIRKPQRFLQLTPWTISNDKGKRKTLLQLNDELLMADAMEIRASCYDVRFFREYANAIFRLTTSQANYKEKTKHIDRFDGRKLDVEDSFLDMMYEKFSITENELCEYYNTLSNIGRYDEVEISLIDLLNNNISGRKYFESRTLLDGKQVHTTLHKNGGLRPQIVEQGNTEPGTSWID
jgi:hypothetical protein